MQQTVAIAVACTMNLCFARGHFAQAQQSSTESGLLRIKTHDAPSRRPAGGLDAHRVQRKRNGQQPVGICVPKVVLGEERQLMRSSTDLISGRHALSSIMFL